MIGCVWAHEFEYAESLYGEVYTGVFPGGRDARGGMVCESDLEPFHPWDSASRNEEGGEREDKELE